MANLQTHTVQEALNAMGPGGKWTVNAAGTAGSSDDTANTTHLDVSGSSQLGVYSAVDIYFNFGTDDSGTNGDVTTANDLIIPGDSLVFVQIPRGLGKTIFFNYLSTSTTTGAVRIVEV